MRIFLTILLFLLASTVGANTYYISETDGNDSRTSTQARNNLTPWKTMAPLLAFISSIDLGDSVLFKRGDTFLGPLPTLVHGGSSVDPIVYSAYGTGADPVITGFTSLPTWSNLGSNIWEAPCNSGLNLELVTMNGVIIPMGRTPNAGSYYLVDSHTALTGATDSKTGTITSTSVPVSTQNYTGAILRLRATAWNIDANPITGHSGNVLSFNSRANNNVTDTNKFFIQHHPSCLDQNGEWYYNSTAHTIRMYSTIDPGTLNVRAATVDNLYYDDPCDDAKFEHLKFTGADSNGIRIRYGTRVKIYNCEFDQIGVDAITMDACTNQDIRNNIITNCGNSGVVGRDGTSTTVMYNFIKKSGVIEGMGLSNNQQRDGIMIETESGTTTINWNVIDSSGYCGIRFTGSLTYVQWNLVMNSGLQLSDGGGIYTNAGSGARYVDHNIIINCYGNNKMNRDTAHGGFPGIYMDDVTTDVDIKFNVLKNCSRYPIFLHNSHEVEVSNNIIYEGYGEAAIGIVHDGLEPESPTRNVTVKNNQINNPSGLKLLDIYSTENDVDSLGVIDSNYYSRPAAGNIIAWNWASGGGNYSLASWQSTFGYDRASSMLAVPTDSVRLEYNSTSGVLPVPLGSNTYMNLLKKGYAGTINLPSFTGLLIYEKTLPRVYLPVRYTIIQQ